MATTRKKIGILFSYSEGWIGGTYYFMNLVHALHSLQDEEKPLVVILSENKASFEKIKETGYPYLEYLDSHFHYTIWERLLNKLSRTLWGRNRIEKGYSKEELPVLFGYYEQLSLHKCERKLFWIPDLQDKHYPQYLGEEVAQSRKVQHEKLAYSSSEIVFSSQDAKRDFNTFYPNATCAQHVVPFAVTLPNLNSLSATKVLDKYGIKDPYYFSPNQFWQHKNHRIVIEAIEKLKKEGKEIQVIFTGNEATGGGTYATGLKEYVAARGLQQNCFFLGFIDRMDQLVLMREAKAVIQPSLFEGWSTVVEDAKCLGKWLILSNLTVHHEQLSENVSFFDPYQVEDLIETLKSFDNRPAQVARLDYTKNVSQFAQTFLHLF